MVTTPPTRPERDEVPMSFDVATLRKDFPTLQREVDGRRLVYLDSAASSQTPRSVLDAMTEYYEELRSNVERGVYRISETATARYESARGRLAEFVHAPSPEGVVFTKNVTEAINLVAYSWVRRRLGPGDALLTTGMEHHANFVPWWHAAQDRGFDLRVIPVTDEFQLDLDAARELLADGNVQFLAVGHVSNVLGTINPLADLIEMAREANPDVVTLVDGAQAVPHLPVDVAALDCDFYGITAHKMCGPTGIGALIAKPERLEDMPPFLTGGSMIVDVRVDEVTWNHPPHRFEAGTPPIAEAFGLEAACDYLDTLGMHAVRAHERDLVAVFVDALRDTEGVTVYGPVDPELRSGAISFAVDGVHPHDLGAMLDRYGVCIRVGHHCAKPLMRSMGVNATARASLYLYNDTDDLAPLLDGIAEAQSFFAR
jgi:cysteine desulfurase / selenocysteine lyase